MTGTMMPHEGQIGEREREREMEGIVNFHVECHNYQSDGRGKLLEDENHTNITSISFVERNK